jgi:hypothetical protein
MTVDKSGVIWLAGKKKSTTSKGKSPSVYVVVKVDSPGPASVNDALTRFHEDGGDDHRSDDSITRPLEGVYSYEGRGTEELSFPPLSQVDGVDLPGTVTHRRGGCWTFRIDFNAAHWQEWRYCVNGGGEGFHEVSGRTGQAWDLGVDRVSNLSSFQCDPPNPVLPAPATGTVEQSCSGTNTAVDGETTSAGPWRFVAPVAISIDGEAVPALHFQGQRTLTGGQDGTENTEVWFRSDGLLLRYERDIEVDTDSPIGAITYTETGWVQLAHLEPRR